MKRMKVVLSRCLICLIFSLGLTGCAETQTTGEPNGTMKIGVITYRGDDTFISSTVKFLQYEAKQWEQEKGMKISINVVDAKGSQSTQNRQVDDFISKGYDVICVNLVDRSVAYTIINKTKETNIPIIFFNREPVEEDIQMWERVYYVGADAREGAELQAEILMDLFRDDPERLDKNDDGVVKYVLLEGEPMHQDSQIRTETVVEELTKGGMNIERLANDTAYWMSSQARTKMESWIEDYADEIELVISNNDEMALGALSAIEAALESGKLKDKPVVVGLDGTETALNKILDGELDGTVLNNAWLQALYILEIAYEEILGGNVDGLAYLEDGHYARAPHEKVTIENAREKLDKMSLE